MNAYRMEHPERGHSLAVSRVLSLTLPTPEQNLALDEALLLQAEASSEPCEVLRLWEPAAPLVVIGSSSRVEAEVDVAACRRRGAPILRRPSGGLSIVTGPGCLMYAVVLSYRLRPELRMIDQAHRLVLERIAAALRPIMSGIERRGISDLVLGEKKFSGNSLRCKQNHLLYHGTLLYDFPLPLIGELLKMPPRSPDYRAGRPHGDFVTNLPIAGETLRRAMRDAFDSHQPLADWPVAETARLVEEKYSQADWNERF